MNQLFEPVPFAGQPLLFASKSDSASHFSDFYHWYQCCEILYIHKGTGSVIVDQKTYEMRQGLLFYFQPYQLHKVYASVSEETPYVRTVIHFEPHYFEDSLLAFPRHRKHYEQLWKERIRESGMDLHASANFIEHVISTFAKSKGQEKGFDEEDMNMLMLQLVHVLMNNLEKIKEPALKEKNSRSFTYSEQMMQWIEEHYSEEIRLDDLAESLHLSKYHLSRLFQQETGSSLSDYILARRIKQACRLLYGTAYSVEHISTLVGYPNASYFIRLFKRVMGTTPLKYRSAAR
ncbi:helix-turn-helix domain-containing protein [Paenibacillus sp. 2TAB23]|uniref:helix-turn-helix domain-containing protein n=1 Tax=Paenibacillus sp. 2TAB23 TaxID=3233004 RepID=UPI003F99D1B7